MDFNNESKLQRYSICCTNIPEALLNKVIAKQHFAQFGKIATMYVRPQQMTCTIDYVDKDSAEDAIEYGGEYDGVLFDINWAPSKKMRPKVVDPDWFPDPDVQAELDALQVLAPTTPRLNRQQPMVIDLTQTDDGIKKPFKSQLTKPKKVSAKSQKNIDIEPRITTTKTPNIDHLKDILTSPALTIEQKYRVLDARDQLIRLQNSSEATVKSDHIKGTCPDMCPEKERLMREYQHQIAQYEQSALDPRVMDHHAAVKQYSRSSADQEIPLPHDLRPVPVLERTMSYLLQNIADISETSNVNLNDWYHFFWDRTRSIRKDITQQGLSCKGSVRLVEQCSRFHIHCAARLVGEDASVFDQRINTENLTKCIQSLKYMYHDLRQKGDICDNEAEFRAYIILLNLNNCNFMWEVQKWSTTIQESPQVQFAIKVFLAVDSNNYVKFFKLVRETSYMNACLLLRYFNQVRTKAISTIVKSFVARIPTTFSLTDMMNILAFETIDQCAQFVEHFGLSCNIQDDVIYLDKQMFAEPDFPFHLSRCFNIIESKRICSVGEAIYGGSIQEKDFSNYIPHSSFDDEGYLTNDALSAADQNNQKNLNTTSSVFESNILKKINPAPDVQKPIGSSVSLEMNRKYCDAFEVKSFSQPSHNSQVHNSIATTSNVFSNFSTKVSESSNNLFQIPNNNIFNSSPVTTSSHFTESINIFKSASSSSNIFSGNQKASNVFSSSGSNIFSKVSSNEENVFAQSISSQNKMTFAQGNTETPKSIFAGATSDTILPNNHFSFGKSSMMNNQTLFSAHSISTSNDKKFTFNLQEDLEKQKLKDEMEKIKKIEEQKEKDQLKQMEIEKKKQICIENCTKKSLNIFEELMNEEILYACESEARNEIDRFYKICDNATKLTEQTIDEFIKIVLQEEIISELSILRALKNIQSKEEDRLSRKYFGLWLQNVLIKKLKRKATEETPIWMPSRSVNEEALLLYRENQNSALENILNYKNLYVENTFIDDGPIRKIDNYNNLHENILKARQRLKPKSKAYWKAVISIPDEIEGSYWSKYINKWVDSTFGETEDLQNNQLLLKEFVDKRYATSMAISIKKTIGCNDNIEDLLGMNSLVFFTLSDSLNQKRMKERLTKIVKHRESPSFSLVIICIKTNEFCNIKDLETFLYDVGVSKKYKIMMSENHRFQTMREKSIAALEWLSKQPVTDSCLQMDSLESFVYNCLGSELIQKLGFASRNNYILRRLFLDPNFIIELYNYAVAKCLEMVSEEALQEYEDFAPELKQFLPNQLHTALTYEYFPTNWRNVKDQCRIRSIVKNFEMPYFENLGDVKDITSYNSFLMSYCTKILSSSEEIEALSNKMLCVALRTINAHEEFQTQTKKLSWIDIIDTLVRELVTIKLNRILDKHPALIIIYNINLFTNYLNEPWWLKSKPFILRNRADQENFKVVEEEYENDYSNKRQRLNSNISTVDEISDSISRALKALDSFDKTFDVNKLTIKKELYNKYERLNLTVQEQASKLRTFNDILDKTVKNFR